MVPLQFRRATPYDAALIAGMNRRLIEDEGHRNRMTPAALAARMEGWLRTNYRALLFTTEGTVVGYVLYRQDEEYVYLRQMFVESSFRRRGIARAALAWLSDNDEAFAKAWRVEVLVGNHAGRAFWRAIGFVDYCIVLERTARSALPP